MSKKLLTAILKSSLNKKNLLLVINNIIKENNLSEKEIILINFWWKIYDLEISGDEILSIIFETDFYSYLELEEDIEILYKFFNIDIFEKYTKIYQKIHILELDLRKI